MLIRISLIVMCLGYAGLLQAAETYWVLGQYADEQAARIEGEQMAGSLSMDVLLYEIHEGSAPRYQVVAGPVGSNANRQALLAAVNHLGVSGVQVLTFAADVPYMELLFEDMGGDLDLAAIDAMIAGFTSESDAYDGDTAPFLVAGSFAQQRNADALQQRLASLAQTVSIRTATVDGRQLHRVVVGPLADASSAREALAAGGIDDGWRIQLPVPSAAQALDLPDQAELEALRRPRNQEMQVEYESDFNLARLKRKPRDGEAD